MKKIFTLLLALVATTALWAEDFEVNGIYYNILTDKTNEVAVTYRGSYYDSYSKEYTGSVTIPETVTYNGTTYSVTSIGEYVFFGCSGLTSITIPNSVTSIGGYAFAYCESLTSVTIPNSVTSIGYQAFYYCESLTSPVYNAHCFAYLPISYQGAYTIPEGIKQIAGGAFWGCESLTSVTIGNSVTSIGDYAFKNCSSLTSITIPNSVMSIGDQAFYKCSSLSSVIIPNSVTSIGDWAFSLCESLTSITIPNSVTRIGEEAFRGCSGLTSIVWNAKNCEDFTSQTYSPFTENSMGIVSPITTVTFGDSVQHIPAYLCHGMNNLTSITIPNSVTSIGDYAFRYCYGLTSVTIGNSVTSIGNYAFYDCFSLTSITIPNSVTSIGDEAFYLCDGLTSVTIPESVTSIGEDAFYRCSDLTSIVVEKGNAKYDCRENCNAIIETATNTLIVGCQNTIIPNSVTSIGAAAFSGCYRLTSITIPNSVTSIGGEAFSYCSGLTFIESLAEVPPTLGINAFYNVPENIPVYVACGSVSAYQSAEGWKDFTNIQEPLVEYSIALGVNDSIMGTAMVDYNTYCKGAQITATANQGYHFVQWSDGITDNPRTLVLTQDTILTAEFALTLSGQCGDNLYWAYDEDSKKISITGSGDMYNYTKSTQPWLLFQEQITEVTTSNTTTSIGTSAFSGCSSLTSITIPNSVTTIGVYAFRDCSGLREISLGSQVKTIGAGAFMDCPRIYEVTCLAQEPPVAEQSSFTNYDAYFHAPCDAQRYYSVDPVWKKFHNVECIVTENTVMDDITITPSDCEATVVWLSHDQAATYSLVITKNGETYCTLTFNKYGQLINIALAPARVRAKQDAAEYTETGYAFTITGLEMGTTYDYTFAVLNDSQNIIDQHFGHFTTTQNSPTSVDNVHSQSTNVQKLIRDGQLLILRDGVEYNAMGLELK